MIHRCTRPLRAGDQVGLSRAIALAIALAGALIAALCQPSLARAANDGISAESASRRPSVLVLGDSISAAYGMSLEQGWVALLERRLQDAGRISKIINASISGDTSAGGLRRLPQLLQEHRPEVLVLELGGNDGLRGYPTAKLRENLQSMARLAREAGSRVLILPMEIPPNYGSRYTRAFRAAFREAAQATDAMLGPFILEGIATKTTLMQADGIHPTEDAQNLIVENIAPAFDQLLQALAMPQSERAAP